MKETKPKIYCRNCPKCNKELCYTLKSNRDQAEKEKRLCLNCSSKKYPDEYYSNTRCCPNCNSIIEYKNINDAITARHVNSRCQQCSYYINKGVFLPGHDRPNKTPLYDCWLKNEGKEIADIKFANWRQKQSENSSGSKNGMYGKPTPVGTGNGWSGWYKNWYFRSLLELSFMVNIIERFNFKWESAEQRKYSIKYQDYKGTERTYRADFILNNKYMVDCKPKKLQFAFNNQLKYNAAVQFCKENNLIFKYSDIPRLTDLEFKELKEKGEIKFLPKYEELFKQKYEAR